MNPVIPGKLKKHPKTTASVLLEFRNVTHEKKKRSFKFLECWMFFHFSSQITSWDITFTIKPSTSIVLYHDATGWAKCNYGCCICPPCRHTRIFLWHRVGSRVTRRSWHSLIAAFPLVAAVLLEWQHSLFEIVVKQVHQSTGNTPSHRVNDMIHTFVVWLFYPDIAWGMPLQGQMSFLSGCSWLCAALGPFVIKQKPRVCSGLWRIGHLKCFTLKFIGLSVRCSFCWRLIVMEHAGASRQIKIWQRTREKRDLRDDWPHSPSCREKEEQKTWSSCKWS